MTPVAGTALGIWFDGIRTRIRSRDGELGWGGMAAIETGQVQREVDGIELRFQYRW
jgi:hypothetical protein